MRIGELAEQAGVNIETLRYYERRGLLPEPPRTPTGHRHYDDETVRFVRAVKEAQGLGFTLAEIEEYLRLSRRRTGRAPQELRIGLARKIDEVDAKIASLHRVRDDLARVLGCACDSLDHCTCGAAYLARHGQDPDPQPTGILHVTNGESAANTLRSTSLGGAVLSWADVLHEGPVPAVGPAELRRVRARFLSECGWGSARTILHSLERRDRLVELAARESRPIVLWFEHDLYDQLQLLQVLAQLDAVGFEPARVELINVGSFPGRPDFHGLGELHAEELESLWPQRRPLTAELAALGTRAWEAVRAPEPTAIEAFLEKDTAELPFLAAALRRLLEDLPDARTGLSRSERQLLELLPGRPGPLFFASQKREDAPFAGDAWAWRLLAELGAGEIPLLERADGAPIPAPPPLGDGRRFAAAELALTDAGRAVLAGKADRVELLGIDRWVGGTHVHDGHVPRWDANVSRVV
jgi:DNA-binding transcriptional MerR regulator